MLGFCLCADGVSSRWLGVTTLKLLADVRDRGDVRVIQTALRELRYAFKLFAPYAQTRKLTGLMHEGFLVRQARVLATRVA